MIEIKSFFTDWHEVNKEQAQDYIKFLLSNMTGIRGYDNKVKYIEEKCLKGITVKELFKE